MAPRRGQTRDPLNHDAIVRKAIETIDTQGFAALTVRSLAAELSVSPMALYRHVRNKDELLLDVTDAMLAHAALPDPDNDWSVFLTEIASSLRRLFLQHPQLVETFARQPVTTPTARRRLEASLEVLRSAGFDDDQATRAYAAVHVYTVGFCGLEAARRAGTSNAPDLDERDETTKSDLADAHRGVRRPGPVRLRAGHHPLGAPPSARMTSTSRGGRSSPDHPALHLQARGAATRASHRNPVRSGISPR